MSPKAASADIGSALPSCPWPSQAGLQGIHAPGLGNHVIDFPRSSRGLRLLSRGNPSTEPLLKSPWLPKDRALKNQPKLPVSSASHEVSSPSAHPHPEQRPCDWACLTQSPAPSGIHNLLAPSSALSLPALFHAGSAPGVPLQSIFPHAQPYAVSGAFPLMTFQTPSGSCSTRESATRPSGLD